MAEKYYGWSPYNFCADDPLNLVDLLGEDTYRINKKTGEIFLYRLEDDVDYDTLIELRGNNKEKVVIKEIEKGILHDHINFKENDQLYRLNEDNQPSIKGLESFVLELSNYVGVEIGGAYFSGDESKAITEVTLGRYRYNSYNSTKQHGQASWAYFHNRNPQLGITGFFHTHPMKEGRDRPSTIDIEARNNILEIMPNLEFYIITYPVNYGDPTPYKISYTHWPY